MIEASPNLFNALFEFHPREGLTPKENFLSEALAHILKTNESARNAWASLMLGRQVQIPQCTITTRSTEWDEERYAIYPDMRLMGVNALGETIELYCEFKWNSPCNPGQLKKYLKVVKQRGDCCHLVFIGASRDQKRAAQTADISLGNRSFLWAAVYEALDALPEKPDLLVQFLEFMKTHGLSPGQPIDGNSMRAFLQATGFTDALVHCANKLNDEYEWGFFPNRYLAGNTREVTYRWGRIAIEFPTPAWKPTISVGFLVDERDHRVTFVDRQRGVDLMLRIESNPGNLKAIKPVLDDLNGRRKNLSKIAGSTLLFQEAGNGNRHTILIMRSCLADVIQNASSQQAQLESIHGKLSEWGKALFKDGLLEKAFKQAGLDSGI